MYTQILKAVKKEAYTRNFMFLFRVRKCLKIGELLFVQGGKGDSMYIIESGAMERFRGGGDTGEPEKFITSLNRGQYIGVEAVLYKMPRSASVRATEESIVWSLNLELYNVANNGEAKSVIFHV